MKYAVACATLLALSFTAGAAEAPTVLTVWPKDKIPGNGAAEPEKETPSKGDGVTRITNVSEPTLTIFPAPASHNPSPAVIICPGGGYNILAFNKEGSDIAAWLNQQGITGFVLKYRVPKNREGALQDIQRAIRLVRSQQKEWNINATRVGVMGFSAGGHLCARLATHHGTNTYPPIDAIDQQSDRPDFAILIYPAYLDEKGTLAPNLTISPKIPPTFIAHSDDDKSFITGSKLFAEALTNAKIPLEFALYPTGGHGYGLHSKLEAKAWPDRCAAWLKTTTSRAKQQEN